MLLDCLQEIQKSLRRISNLTLIKLIFTLYSFSSDHLNDFFDANIIIKATANIDIDAGEGDKGGDVMIDAFASDDETPNGGNISLGAGIDIDINAGEGPGQGGNSNIGLVANGSQHWTYTSWWW